MIKIKTKSMDTNRCPQTVVGQIIGFSHRTINAILALASGSATYDHDHKKMTSEQKALVQGGHDVIEQHTIGLAYTHSTCGELKSEAAGAFHKFT